MTGRRLLLPGAQLPQRLQDERPLPDSRVRYLQIGLRDALAAEYEDIHVDDAWAPTLSSPAPAVALHRFDGLEQLARCARPIHLHDLVQESGLVNNSPGRGVYDAALTQNARSLLTQSTARRA